MILFIMTSLYKTVSWCRNSDADADVEDDAAGDAAGEI